MNKTINPLLPRFSPLSQRLPENSEKRFWHLSSL